MVPNEEHLFQGIHILGELYGIEAELLDDVKLLEDALKEGIEASGATLCGFQTKKFEPQGVTILGLLSESHASIHTYPDKGALFFDAFTCGDRCQPVRIAEALIKALKPGKSNLKSVRRGEDTGTGAPLTLESEKVFTEETSESVSVC